MKTSNYTFSGNGGLNATLLGSPATAETTYDSMPAATDGVYSVPSVLAGQAYVVTSSACSAGRRIGYKVASIGGLDLEYFQDSGQPAIGFYITVC